MDLYYEQNVVNNNIDERTRKTKTLSIAKAFCYILGLFILISCILVVNFFWVFILMSLPFFCSGIIIGRINKRNNTEYDYIVDDEYLTVAEIYFRARRKLKFKIKLREIESVGVFDSEGYKKIQNSAIKKYLALVNYDDEKSVVYILHRTERGRNILFIEPDRGFVIALRRAIATFSIFDSSMSDLEKRLTKKENEEIFSNNGANVNALGDAK